MVEVNTKILEALVQSRNKLCAEAVNQIKRYLETQLHPDGGFVDRAGNPDPYYSVFGYTLAFVYDLEMPIDKQLSFIKKWSVNHKVDFIHALSLLRCSLLISAVLYKSRIELISDQLSGSVYLNNQIRNRIIKKTIQRNGSLLKIIESYRSKDKGFNQDVENAGKASVYATFLVWSLFQDLDISDHEGGINECINNLNKSDRFFGNDTSTGGRVTTATAAGLIMTLLKKNQNKENTISWLKNRWVNQGGFVATEGIEIADMLSTSTALLALNLAGVPMSLYSDKCEGFINLHWDNSGGFFGSVADMIPDCEYTYYALLALGLI